MLSVQKQQDEVDGLAGQLRNETDLTPDLLHRIVAKACTRLPELKGVGKAANMDRLAEAGAWCDVAFALIAIELPAWSIRRVVREDGEWFCSLTREPNLPAALDDTVDASHQTLPLAILCAFLEARRKVGAKRSITPAMPQVRPACDRAICCDNFA